MTRALRAQKSLQARGHHALVTADPHLLYYFTGVHFTAGTIVITKDAYHLFVDGRYITQAEPLRKHFCVHEYASKQDLPNILKANISHLTGSIAFCPTKTSYESFFRMLALCSTIPGLALTADAELFDNLRRHKDNAEKENIQKAVQLTNQVIQEAFEYCKDGISEKDLAAFIKIRFLEQHAGIAFDPIVAFGINSACPHWTPSDDRLFKQDVILIDCGAQWNGYDGDMTRTLFYKKPSKEIQHAYDAVQKAYHAAKALAKPGIAVIELYESAVAALKEEGLDQFFNHGLGHGVGLEIHEAPSLKKNSHNVFLEEGDVITIEPGVYLPGIGGIRYENTLFIGKEKAESFLE